MRRGSCPETDSKKSSVDNGGQHPTTHPSAHPGAGYPTQRGFPERYARPRLRRATSEAHHRLRAGRRRKLLPLPPRPEAARASHCEARTSTLAVTRDTLARAAEAQLTVAPQPEWCDVDTVAERGRARAELDRRPAHRAMHTSALISDLPRSEWMSAVPSGQPAGRGGRLSIWRSGMSAAGPWAKGLGRVSVLAAGRSSGSLPRTTPRCLSPSAFGWRSPRGSSRSAWNSRGPTRSCP